MSMLAIISEESQGDNPGTSINVQTVQWCLEEKMWAEL